jgi:hypothetical protein
VGRCLLGRGWMKEIKVRGYGWYQWHGEIWVESLMTTFSLEALNTRPLFLDIKAIPWCHCLQSFPSILNLSPCPFNTENDKDSERVFCLKHTGNLKYREIKCIPGTTITEERAEWVSETFLRGGGMRSTSDNGSDLTPESRSQNGTSGVVMILKQICTITFHISLKTLSGIKFLISSRLFSLITIFHSFLLCENDNNDWVLKILTVCEFLEPWAIVENQAYTKRRQGGVFV